ncbi:MAG: VWA domain-containing protein [Deltaproteobacteria bacterium]|nr:VWA domain-containing protein [Deltaproteobacteria bacterium]
MTESFFQLADPWFLLLWAAIPIGFFLARKRKEKTGLHFSSAKIFEGLKKTRRERLEWLVPFLRGLALALLVLALSRPQAGNKTTETIGEGIDILLAIDTSGSMKALDFHLKGSEVNRLDVVKEVVKDFVEKRRHDRIGMVVFGEEAYTQCPLTTDTGTLLGFLQRIRIGIAGDGTAIGNALATSLKRLKSQKTKSRIVILLTDGRNNAGEVSPLTAAQIAAQLGIKVYAIGIGSNRPVPYPEETAFGVRKIYANLEQDEAMLREIARIAGGKYFHASMTEELKKVYETIDRLEKSEIKVKEYNEYRELFVPFALACLLFLILEILLSRTLFLRIP